MAAQPMQMFMMPMTQQLDGSMLAPMNAPVMMPMPQLDGGAVNFTGAMPQLANMDYSVPYSGPYSWTTENSWQMYNGATFFGEGAPQQIPMQEFSAAKPVRDARCESYSPEEVPTQVQMDSMGFQPQVQKTTTAAACTLRRRRGQECSPQEALGNGADSVSLYEQRADQDVDTEASDAQAREIASRLIEQLQAGGDAQQMAIASFERLAFTSKITSRAAQIILEETSMADAAEFATGLRGHVRNAVQSKHANHVLQKITEVMPVARASFVVDELKGFGQEVVRHGFGCRVLCRILEHLSPNDTSTIELFEEVFTDLDELCSHSFGSFVVRHLLEFGLPSHKQRIVVALRKDLIGYAKHKFGSHVVEAALRHASPDDQRVLARELLADKEQLMVLAANQFGRHVVRALLATPADIKKEAVAILHTMESQLKSSRYGKSVMQALRTAVAA